MSDNKITIRRAYIEECDRFWQNAPVKWTHNKITNSKTLDSVENAKSYIKTASGNWDLDTNVKRDRMFLNTLYDNCEQAGAAATQYFTAQYSPGQQYGICKYILVVIYNRAGGRRITVAYAYHDIDENLFGSNSVYTKYAEAITEHWLKSKSVESIKEMVEREAWPQVEYE